MEISKECYRLLAEQTEQRFWSKIQKQKNGCWLWIGSKSPKGYGLFCVAGTVMTAHRFSYFRVHGRWPESTDHLCRVKACVNPEHLESVTIAENHHRRPRTTHCKHGHAMTEANTYTYKQGDTTHRACRQCRNASNRLYFRRLHQRDRVRTDTI